MLGGKGGEGRGGEGGREGGREGGGRGREGGGREGRNTVVSYEGNFRSGTPPPPPPSLFHEQFHGQLVPDSKVAM